MVGRRQPSIGRLILGPVLISLAVTLVRVAGELRHWPKPWFAPQSGAIGITWMAPIFGIYFGIKLAIARDGPRSWWRAIGFGLLGAALLVSLGVLSSLVFKTRPGFQARLLLAWGVFALAGALTLPGWLRLWKTLLAYAYLARLPVVVVMFFAFRGSWGTHYDALPGDFTGTTLAAKWLWLGFFPQFTLWVGFTLVAGMLFGSIAAAVVRLGRRPAAALAS